MFVGMLCYLAAPTLTIDQSNMNFLDNSSVIAITTRVDNTWPSSALKAFNLLKRQTQVETLRG